MTFKKWPKKWISAFPIISGSAILMPRNVPSIRGCNFFGIEKNVTNWKILILLWVKIGYNNNINNNNNNNLPEHFKDIFLKELTSKSTVLAFYNPEKNRSITTTIF
jgi:hypothetical protein